jgi:hypothetical protein
MYTAMLAVRNLIRKDHDLWHVNAEPPPGAESP